MHGNTIVQNSVISQSAADGDVDEGHVKLRTLSGAERSFRDHDKVMDLHRGIKSSHSMLSFTFDKVFNQAASTSDLMESSYIQSTVKGAL